MTPATSQDRLAAAIERLTDGKASDMEQHSIIVRLGRRLRSAARWLHGVQQDMPPPEVAMLLLLLGVACVAAIAAFAWAYPWATAASAAVVVAVWGVWKAGAP